MLIFRRCLWEENERKNRSIYSHSASAESGIPKKVVLGLNSGKMCIMATRTLLYTFLRPPPFFLFFLPSYQYTLLSTRLRLRHSWLKPDLFQANFYLHTISHTTKLRASQPHNPPNSRALFRSETKKANRHRQDALDFHCRSYRKSKSSCFCGTR